MGKPKKKSMNVKVIAIVAAVIMAAGTVAAFMSTSFSTPSTLDSRSEEELVMTLTSPSIPEAYALGSADAGVTVVEFGDYQCTWCMRFHQETKDELMSKYVETGQVRFLFKDFPINDQSDRASSLAAMASYCAADQGKYWEYHDEVYNNWAGENPTPPWVTKTSLNQFAANAGVPDLLTFSECLDSGKYSGTVRDNYNLARSLDLGGTPNFLVLADGKEAKLVPGAAPIEYWDQLIQDMQS